LGSYCPQLTYVKTLVLQKLLTNILSISILIQIKKKLKGKKCTKKKEKETNLCSHSTSPITVDFQMNFPSFPVDVIVTPSPPYPISVSHLILGLPPGGSQLSPIRLPFSLKVLLRSMSNSYSFLPVRCILRYFNWEKVVREFIIDSTGQRYIRTNKIRMWYLEKENDNRYVHITNFHFQLT
jgi:hypothetical protein